MWEAAFKMLDDGFWIFPLADFGKLPRRTKAKGSDEILPEAKELHLVDSSGRGGFYAAVNGDRREIVELWAKELPRANYAVMCGHKTGTTVVDLDRHGTEQDGVAVFKNWRQEREAQCSFWVSTPSNGLHLYYKYFPGSSRTVVSGIELQNHGRYVVGPGCRTHKGTYWPCQDEIELQEAPGWLTEIVGSKHGESIKTEKMSLLSCVATFGYVPEGFRHDAVFMEAVVMMCEQEMDEEVAFHELRDLINRYVVGGEKFPDDEIRRNLKNASKNKTILKDQINETKTLTRTRNLTTNVHRTTLSDLVEGF